MFHKNITVKKPANSVVYPRNNYVYFNCEKIYIKEKSIIKIRGFLLER
ncbi:hypothetical protein NMU03_03495 [Allocoprobacillus halotolerans]|uniref:Uncharacterized protein n=1 Tax=Allocoprobacillus halotolerans TaxID=2944914 RepID=A0ABY5I3H0_9FIRM|nr:hypothetical protein [Allocoprobacillus halotolerans]UTY39881.1 hypothetical protein NMU03_03495 [Allocoprobacillus halotolerans]